MTLDASRISAGNTVYFIPTDDRNLLGILNSKLIFFYFKRNSSILGDAEKGGRLRWFNQDVVKIPINPVDKAQHDKLVSLVSSMLNLNQHLSTARTDQEKTVLSRQIEATDRRIDELVYELYGLTEEEITIVEGGK
ncbi:MAG: hypothetical protein ABSE00_02170 [Chitinispirillaceae bacterium]